MYVIMQLVHSASSGGQLLLIFDLLIYCWSGVEEATPHLKSSQVAVKGKVEPATLVGFIHKCTGRRAAIIRAEPLDDALLPQPPNPPAAPPASKAESKKDEPPAENPPAKVEEPNEENRGGGEKDNADDDNPKTEKPASDGHGAGAAEEHGAHATTEGPDRDNDDDAGDGLVLENHTKAAVDRLFAVPTPAGVVAVAPEMALGSRSYCYPAYPCAQYYYPYQPHLYPPQPYPAASAYSPVAMYGYPASYPPEAFSEENPNACTIV